MPASNPGAQIVPEFESDEKDHRRKIATALNGVLRGKINATIDVTLTANAASTTINDARIGYYSAIMPAMATTAHAATELASGNVYIDTIKSGAGVAGSCVVHHTNNAQTDRTIRFLIIG